MSRCEIITRRAIVYLGLIIGFSASGDIGAEANTREGPREGYDLDVSQGSLDSALSTEVIRPSSSDSVQSRSVRKPVDAERHGNPLWAIPLSVLSATRERPLFSSSRRPPAQAVAAPPHPEPVSLPPPPAPTPEVPGLALVGAVVNADQGIAVFVDTSTRTVIRLKVGEAHLGWVLRVVLARETTLEKNQRTVTLKLPLPGEPQVSAAMESATFAAGTGGSGVLPGLTPVNPVARGKVPVTAIPLAPSFAAGSVPSVTGRLPGL
jgi:hypothetical protein